MKLFDTHYIVWLPKLRLNSAKQRIYKQELGSGEPSTFVREVSHEVQTCDSFRIDLFFIDGILPDVRAPRKFRIRHVENGAYESDHHEI